MMSKKLLLAGVMAGLMTLGAVPAFAATQSADSPRIQQEGQHRSGEQQGRPDSMKDGTQQGQPDSMKDGGQQGRPDGMKNGEKPPEPPKDKDGNPLPPPDGQGYAGAKGRV